MGKRYVGFTVGDGRYGIPIEYVVQIIRYENITNIPMSPPFVEGVLNLRGEVIPVINIRERFGLDRIDITRKHRIIVVTNEGRNYGLLVDGVREIIDLGDEEISAKGTAVFGIKADLVLGIAKIKDDLLVILDVFKILSTPASTLIRSQT